jgi:flagellin
MRGLAGQASSETLDDSTSLTNGGTTPLDVQVGIDHTSNDGVTLPLDDARSTALDTVNGCRASYGTPQDRLDSTLADSEPHEPNLRSAESPIRDAGSAYETAQLAKQQIIQPAGVSVLAQTNVIDQGNLSLVWRESVHPTPGVDAEARCGVSASSRFDPCLPAMAD